MSTSYISATVTIIGVVRLEFKKLCVLTLEVSLEEKFFPSLLSNLPSVYLRKKEHIHLKFKDVRTDIQVELFEHTSAKVLVQYTFKGAQSLVLGRN